MITLSINDEERYAQLQSMALKFAKNGNIDELSKMINSGLNVNTCDHKGNTLLMLASYNNQLEVVQFLIYNNAKVDKKNDKGQTPLSGVCFKGYFEMVKLLVEKGSANINESNGMGTTALTFASIFGHQDIFDYLNKDNKNKSYSIVTKIVSTFRGFNS
jgi:ankyrin repeat protein